MPTAASPIVTVPQAQNYLGVTGRDSDLAGVINTASQMIVNRIGQVAGSPTVDEWHDGGCDRIMLYNQGPIQSVTSVTESYGTIVYTLTQVSLDAGSANAYGFTIDLDSGLLVRRASGIATLFAPGVRNVHVTYVAGYATVPADITEACLYLVKHLWDPRRGAGTRNPGTGGTEPQQTPLAFPPRVEEILAPYTVPGIA